MLAKHSGEKGSSMLMESWKEKDQVQVSQLQVEVSSMEAIVEEAANRERQREFVLYFY